MANSSRATASHHSKSSPPASDLSSTSWPSAGTRPSASPWPERSYQAPCSPGHSCCRCTTIHGSPGCSPSCARHSHSPQYCARSGQMSWGWAWLERGSGRTLLFNPALLIYYEVELGDRRPQSSGGFLPRIPGQLLKSLSAFIVFQKGNLATVTGLVCPCYSCWQSVGTTLTEEP